MKNVSRIPILALCLSLPTEVWAVTSQQLAENIAKANLQQSHVTLDGKTFDCKAIAKARLDGSLAKMPIQQYRDYGRAMIRCQLRNIEALHEASNMDSD